MKSHAVRFADWEARAARGLRKQQLRLPVVIPQDAHFEVEDVAENPSYYINCGWCPFGKAGDILWVQEAHHLFAHGDPAVPGGARKNQIVYRADEEDSYEIRWRSATQMRRYHSRFTFEILDLSAEYIKHLGTDGMLREGIIAPRREPGKFPEGFREWSEERKDEWVGMAARADYIAAYENTQQMYEAFQLLWDAKWGKKGFLWEYNPLVWVATLKPVQMRIRYKYLSDRATGHKAPLDIFEDEDARKETMTVQCDCGGTGFFVNFLEAPYTGGFVKITCRTCGAWDVPLDDYA